MKIAILAYLLFSLNQFALADKEVTIVAVGEAELKKEKILITSPKIKGRLTSKQKRDITEVLKLIKSDFAFYSKIYEVNLDRISFKKSKKNRSLNNKISRYDHILSLEIVKKNKFLDYKLVYFDVALKINNFEKRGVFPRFKLRRWAHDLTDQIYKKMTGKDSIFKTQIIFVSDRPTISRKEPIKELYIMDYDGGNRRRLTYLKGNVISPDISSDKSKIVFSLIKDKSVGRKKIKKTRNVDLYVHNLTTGRNTRISSFRGLNSGAVFLEGNNKIALTLTHTGNAEIFIMDINTKKLSRVTKHFAIDVDPSITLDGTLMTFLSGRSGAPMVYTLDPRGIERNVKRISYVGRFNATPRFSPNGAEIAFSSWLDNRFDIFRISSDGTQLVRLTKNFGSNEDPVYSKDGQFIAFSSQRVLSRYRAVQNIYIMDRDGESIVPVLENFGNCITPRWSK